MKCESIRLENFRNIQTANVTFSPGVNLLIGDNAQGKTNLLEAVYLCAIGKSFRGAKDADMISFGKESSTVSLDYSDDIRRMNIQTTLRSNGRRSVEQNGLAVKKTSELVGGLRAVLFCPEHLSLIKDGPQARRQFLDVALSQIKPLYLSALQRYCKILKERNTLLKDASRDAAGRKNCEQTIDLWSSQLAKEGATLCYYRAHYVQKLNEAASHVFRDMTGGREKSQFSYLGTCHMDAPEDYFDRALTEQKLLTLLSTSLEREIGAACTLWGPHRDDIGVYLNGSPARLFASQGQQRSLCLSMKLSEGEIIKEEYGDYPVYLFDDVQSELDASRRDYLTERIKQKQVILTTCEPSEQKRHGEANVITVKNGTFEQK